MNATYRSVFLLSSLAVLLFPVHSYCLLAPETPFAQQDGLEGKLFNHNPEDLEKQTFDVIIIGSGMGGGTLARRLIEHGKRILLVERGGLLWTTHTLNTARPHSKHLVNPTSSIEGTPTQDNDFVYHDFWTKYEVDKTTPPPHYDGGPVFSLGGRSALWGLYSPAIDNETMHRYFPEKMVSGLTTRGVEDNSSYVELSKRYLSNNYAEEPEKKVKEAIIDALKNEGFKDNWETAYIASEFTTTRIDQDGEITRRPYTFPLGAYSTIDFLLDYAYNQKENEKSNYTCNNNTDSYILLRTQALKFITEEVGSKKNITSVEVQHLPSGKVYKFKARIFVLAAGTVESYRIAKNSDVTVPLNGITDHSLLYYYFVTKHKIPFVPITLADSAAKLQTYITLNSGRTCLLNIAINSDLFLGRKVAEVAEATKDQSMTAFQKKSTVNKASAIVFEFTDPLDKRNTITIQGENTKLRMFQQEVSKDEMKELTGITTKVVQALGLTIEESLRKEPEHDPNELCTPKKASLGSVAHEVGTLPICGPQPQDCVVNENLKFIQTLNLYGCDLSVFPVSPAANPSRTLVALALRLGDHLTNIINQQKDNTKKDVPHNIIKEDDCAGEVETYNHFDTEFCGMDNHL